MVDIECTWDNTDSGRRRREFCNKYEGYGSICSCQDPAPLDSMPKPVSVMSCHNLHCSLLGSKV